MSGACGKALAALACLPLAAAACAAALARRSLPRLQGKLELPGLREKVRVDYDRWGVPHISAHALSEAVFAQGYLTAQDRMVQMEMFRRVSAGRLAEIAGRRALGLDGFLRDIGISRTASLGEGALTNETRFYLERYAEGVNAYLRGRRWALPPELLVVAGGLPRPWKVADSLSVLLLLTWTMDATWSADLMRGRLVRLLGREDAEVLLPACGPGGEPAVTCGGSRPIERIDPGADCEVDFFPYDEDAPPWMVGRMSVRALGSNNWVLSGSRTASGKPLLCGDPHAQHAVPTLFHLCHLRSREPECNVVGAALPGIPGIFMGRNENIAWGSTSLCPDVVDLYIETFADESSLRYRVGDGWEEAECREEVIRVFPGRRVTRRVVCTRHGPVIARRGNKGLALKWVGHDPRNDSAGCFLRLGLARDWEEFNRGLEGYSGPALNLVYADREGNIGYAAAGRIPLREGHDGSLPLPGDDPSYDWKGYVPREEMPRALNPERGWIATANSRVVDAGYPHHITSMWEPSCRQARIAQLLEAKEKHDPRSMREMQADTFTLHGSLLRNEMLRAGGEWKDAGPDVRRALELLARWDCRATEDSAAQSIYYLAWKVLTERLLRHRLGHRMFFDYTTSFFNLNHAVARILGERREEWLPPSAPTYEELLRQCLEEALVRLQTRFATPEMDKWEWGRLHSLEIPHGLGSRGPLRRLLNVGPVKRGGDGETVNSAFPACDPTIQVLARSSTGGGHPLPFLPPFHSDRACAGPVFRMIVDLCEEGRSLWCLDVGQCAHPASPFYRNFFPLWKRVDYAPMALREEEVREVAANTLHLHPA